MVTELKPDQLRRAYDPAALEFETTADVAPANGIIGQPRGVQAISFGLGMTNPGYNIFVLGEAGTGRTSAIQHFVETRARSQPAPNDWAYVYNFAEEDHPLALELPAGTAVKLRDDLQTLIHKLRGDIALAFDKQSFRDDALEVQHNLDLQREALFAELRAKAQEQGAVLLPTSEGPQLAPADANGELITPEAYAQLDEPSRVAWKEVEHRLQHDLSEAIFQARKLEQNATQELDALKRRIAASVVDSAIAELKAIYAHLPEVADYLDQVHNDIIDHVDAFRANDDDDNEETPYDEPFRRYQVNVLVDHQDSTRAPVIVELDPTLPRLLGRIEHESQRNGAVVTDHTLIRAGAVHAANGGYLVMRAIDLFQEHGAWEALKRTLVAREVRPDDPATRGGTAVRSLEPAPIPLKLKIILTGTAYHYYVLHDEDEDFRTLFKVMADFDDEVDRTPESERDYATFITTRVKNEGLRHMERAAVGRIIEYGSRLAETQLRLSTRFGKIADLVREANYWAGEAGHELITGDDVQQALDNREFLNDRIKTRQLELLLHGKRLVTTSGTAVGQINGLTVSEIGEYMFGQPVRITARTYVGREGIIHIEREVEMSGPSHDKGVLTLVGYLGGTYATEAPLSLSAQITFEQTYGVVDGDSASAAELYALLSSLSGMPLCQNVAVTGSVNQTGEIQAIGGVTEKVEGWYAVCEAAGLDGTQGVLLPASNIDDLMLRPAVVQAVAEGRFHLWCMQNVDDGLEHLTGRPAVEVHTAVSERLAALATALEEHKGEDDDDD